MSFTKEELEAAQALSDSIDQLNADILDLQELQVVLNNYPDGRYEGKLVFFNTRIGRSIETVEVQQSDDDIDFLKTTLQSTIDHLTTKRNTLQTQFDNTCIEYILTFIVTDGSNPVENATVTFNQSTYNTNAAGIVQVHDIQNGNYTYTVDVAGFQQATGSVIVNSSDLTETVTLVP